MRKKIFKNVVLLGIVSLLTDISSEMVYPLIPYFLIYTLGTNYYFLGVIEGVAESTASLLKIFFGVYSDRIKKRKIFAFSGYSASLLGKLMLASAVSWPWVLASRFTDRFGKGVRTAPRDALIAESVNEENQGAAFGLHRAMDTLGAVIGVGLAFVFLVKFNGDVRPVFYLALAPAVLSIGILLFFVKDYKSASKPESACPNRDSKRAGQNIIKAEEQAPVNVRRGKKLSLYWSAMPSQLKIFLGISFIFTVGNSSNLFLILKALNIGFLPLYALLLYGAYNISHALSSYPASKLSDRVGRRIVLASGYLIFGVIYLAFAFIEVQTFYWLLFIVYGLYSGLTEGVEKAFVSDNSPPGLKATAMGMHAAVVGVTLLPASILAGVLWQFFGPSAPFYFSSLTGFVSTILILKYIK